MWILRSRSLKSLPGRLTALRSRRVVPNQFCRRFSTSAVQVELEFEPEQITNVVYTEAWVHPKLEKSQDLLAKGAELLAQGRWDDAFPLLESAIELQEKFQGNLEGSVASYIYQKLGFVYHRLGKFDVAEEHYLKALKNFKALYGPTSRDVGVTCLYLSELLATQSRNTKALEYVTEAVSILRTHHRDVYLGGALSNHATILCATGDYSAALPLFSEALDHFICDVGRDNDYTRKCFQNLYLAYKQLGMNEEINQLKEKWDTVDKIIPADVTGLTNHEVANIVEEFSATIKKAEPKWIPFGFTKGPGFVKKEINQFLKLWKSRGNTFDTLHHRVLDQESRALFNGIKARKVLTNVLNEQRTLLVEQRKKRIEGVDAELRKKIRFDKRFEKESLLFEREHKYTKQMADFAGIEMDDLASSKAERNFLWETKQIIKNIPEDAEPVEEGEEGEEPVESEPVDIPMPSHMIAREVLWPLKFKDYEGKPDLWRTEGPNVYDRDDFQEEEESALPKEDEQEQTSDTSDSESYSTSDGETNESSESSAPEKKK